MANRRKPPNAGKGRPKGSQNKLTKAAREAFEIAFDRLGGTKTLAKWARENQTEFYKLYARLIPVEQRLADANGELLQVKSIIEFVNAPSGELRQSGRVDEWNAS